MKIIDVSYHNGTVYFNKIASAGIDGVIIRAGYGRVISQKDKQFENNYKNASEAGLHIGAYWYSYAADPAEAKKEAEVFIQVIKNKKFDLPVYFDIEEPSHVRLGKTMCADIAETFCEALEKAGYFCGICSFDSFFTTNLPSDISKRFSCWVARYGAKPVNPHDMWQYSCTEKFDEMAANFDISECYKNFPEIIKNAGLNGYREDGRFSVKAEISGISPEKAESVVSACKELGMKTSKIKE